MPWGWSRTGGELTLFQAVGPSGLTTFRCVARRRSRDVRRDLIGAWQRPQQAVSAGDPPVEVEVNTGDDRARGGRSQALAHDRRGLSDDGRVGWRADGPGRREGLRCAV